MTRPTDPFYHTDRFKIEWIDHPEGGVKSACGRFILRMLPPYQLPSGKWVHPCVLFDKNPPGVRRHRTTYRLRRDALCDAEFRRRQDE